MSPRDMLKYSDEFLPYLDKPKSVPLGHRELERLYVFTDWRVVLLDKRVKETYQEFSTISIFKALALPYLINIPTERALARELKERDNLQILCGFLPGQIPQRGTFWNFRRKYAEIYPELMLRILIVMVLSGDRPNLTLPFVSLIPETEKIPNGHHSIFELDAYRPKIQVWTTPVEGEVDPPIKTTGKTMLELKLEIQEREAYRRQNSGKKGLASELGLPAEVKTELNNNKIVRFGIDKPEWIDTRMKGKDLLNTVGPAVTRPYATCNILVMREYGNRPQILLSRRLAGYGRGTYTLPGGKQGPNESLQACAIRELKEETGLRLLRSRPVSMHNTRFPGKPRVQSIGVLAEEYEGKPQHHEPNQNTEWEWFDLDKLPTPLFEPTRITIFQYINKRYDGLQWNDVEAQIGEPEEPVIQLPFLFEGGL